MDPLRADDIARATRLTPSDALAQALELMDAGLALQRERLRQLHTTATADELAQLMKRWLRDENV